MLEQTFVHLPAIGETTERCLWEGGMMTWADALGSSGPPRGFSAPRWEFTQRLLEGSVRALACHDHMHFSAGLKRKDHWRAWPEFQARTAFLDIETTGLTSSDIVTVVVTYNGASFDLPFLARCIPGLRFPQLHVDLMYPLRRLGLSGGLKAVEQRVGLKRAPDVAGLDGWDAVRLWRRWESGSQASLDLLVRYNTAEGTHGR